MKIMTALRSYLAAFLVFALVVTSHSMAQARGMTDAQGQMVICTGTGPITVLVDAEGRPVERSHVCPECAMHLFAGTSAPFEPPLLELRGGETLWFLNGTVTVPVRIARATARGPPVLI